MKDCGQLKLVVDCGQAEQIADWGQEPQLSGGNTVYVWTLGVSEHKQTWPNVEGASEMSEHLTRPGIKEALSEHQHTRKGIEGVLSDTEGPVEVSEHKQTRLNVVGAMCVNE